MVEIITQAIAPVAFITRITNTFSVQTPGFRMAQIASVVAIIYVEQIEISLVTQTDTTHVTDCKTVKKVMLHSGGP